MHREALVDLIRYAVMAPSGHNTQPWVFVIGDGRITIRPDFSRRLPVVDPDDHALFISLGCALENLVLAAEHESLEASVAYCPDDTAQSAIQVALAPAGLDVQGESNSTTARLFAAIPERQSTRRTFDGRPLPWTVCEELQAVAADPLVTTRLITEHSGMETVAEHVEAAARAQFEDPAFVAELMHWIRFSRKEAAVRRDGLSAHAMGQPSVPRWLGESLMRLATGPRREAARAAGQVRSSSAVMVFTATEETPEAWMRTGRCFERAALWATAEGIKHAHVNMPCEVPAVRDRFQRALGLPGRPLLLIRLGYAKPMPSSWRRPVGDVIRYTQDPSQ